jgi:hypothetical protein
MKFSVFIWDEAYFKLRREIYVSTLWGKGTQKWVQTPVSHFFPISYISLFNLKYAPSQINPVNFSRPSFHKI